MSAAIYSLPAGLYEAIYLLLTAGAEERTIKRPSVKRLDLRRGQTVLDWGCGTGLLLSTIAEELGGEGSIVGVDRAHHLIRRAAAKKLGNDKLKTSFVVCDGSTGLSLSSSVDVVIACYSLGVSDGTASEAALSEIRNVLRPGGKILIIDMYRPEPHTRMQDAYYRTHAFFARWLFNQDFSGAALNCARRLFREVSFEQFPSFLAYAWIGARE